MAHTKESVKATMRELLVEDKGINYIVDARTGEVNSTRLAEVAADAEEHWEWLDDDLHWVWDAAVEVEWENKS